MSNLIKKQCLVLLFSLLIFPGFLFNTTTVFATPELKGTTAILNEIKNELNSSESNQPPDPILAKHIRLKKNIDHFVKTKSGLSEGKAAKEWFRLIEEYLNTEPINGDILILNIEQLPKDFSPVDINYIIKAIPGPDSWPKIQKLMEKRKIDKNKTGLTGLGLKLLIYSLNGENEKALSALKDYETQPHYENDYYGIGYEQSMFNDIKNRLTFNLQSKDEGNIIEMFEKLIKYQQASNKDFSEIIVPDLASFADEKKVSQLLLEILKIKGVSIHVPYGKETLRIAQDTVLKHIDEIEKPQWALVSSIDSVELFEALQKKYGDRKEVDPNIDISKFVQDERIDYFRDERENNARTFYILGLIARDQVQKAIDYTLSLNYEVLYDNRFSYYAIESENNELIPNLFLYYEKILKAKPELPFWEEYVSLAPVVHKTEQVLEELKTAVSNKKLNFIQKIKLKSLLVKTYLAIDSIDDALQVIRDIIKYDPANEAMNIRNEFEQEKLSAVDRLLKLGEILNRKDLIEEGISIVKEGVDEKQISLYDYGFGYQNLTNTLIRNKKYVEAEDNILKVIIKNLKYMKTSGDENSTVLSGDFSQLMNLYTEVGRYQDVIDLLEQSPWWGIKDLINSTDSTILLSSARSLYELKRYDEALKILKYYLLTFPSDDDAYRLLVSAGGSDIIPWLDTLYSMNRFEERPLIWKADLLKQSGRYDEAEQVIRKAMEIDPTDGEQEAGQRIFSYTVLADILDAKGKKEDAAFFRKVVESVRLAEKGDDFTEVGLIERSIKLYEQAETIFTDAYCIQWRLGERLYATGDIDAAREHYKIAFERMPEQFGQAASFCFGCEGVFNKHESRSVAETVLLNVVKTIPQKPQVYYLIGLLRKSQNRYPEAYEYFKKASELDPDYMDALVEMHNLSSSLYLPAAESNKIFFKILRMDPFLKHIGRYEVRKVTDFKKLWKVLEENQKNKITAPESLYVLKESKKAIENREKKLSPQERLYSLTGGNYYQFQDWNIPSPIEVIMENETIQNIITLFSYQHMY